MPAELSPTWPTGAGLSRAAWLSSPWLLLTKSKAWTDGVMIQKWSSRWDEAHAFAFPLVTALASKGTGNCEALTNDVMANLHCDCDGVIEEILPRQIRQAGSLDRDICRHSFGIDDAIAHSSWRDPEGFLIAQGYFRCICNLNQCIDAPSCCKLWLTRDATQGLLQIHRTLPNTPHALHYALPTRPPSWAASPLPSAPEEKQLARVKRFCLHKHCGNIRRAF